MKPGMKERYNRDKKQKWWQKRDRMETDWRQKKRQIGDKMKTKIQLKISP